MYAVNKKNKPTFSFWRRYILHKVTGICENKYMRVTRCIDINNSDARKKGRNMGFQPKFLHF